MRSSSSLVLFLLVSACQVKAGVNASVNANESHSEQESFSSTTPPSAPASTGTTTQAAAPAPAEPPPSACPLTCYVASGAERIDVSEQELASIRTGLEPALGKMRACTSPEAWRHRGSPTLHLRVAPDGTVGEVDVDPHHGYDYERTCIEQAAHAGGPAISLPGRSTVRCAEHCRREHGARRGAPRNTKKK